MIYNDLPLAPIYALHNPKGSDTKGGNNHHKEVPLVSKSLRATVEEVPLAPIYVLHKLKGLGVCLGGGIII